MIKNKKILILSPFNPFPPYSGTTTRIYEMCKHLAAENDIFVVIRDEGKAEVPFQSKVIRNTQNKFLGLLNIPLLIRLLKLIRKEKIDIVISSTVLMGLSGAFLKILGRVFYILDDHNVEFLRLRRTGKKFWPAMFVWEKFCITLADLVLCVSTVDREHFKKSVSRKKSKYQVIENGVDYEKFSFNSKSRAAVREKIKAGNRIVAYFNGHMDYKPNQEALEELAYTICPKLMDSADHIMLLIIGGGTIDAKIIEELEKYPFVKVCGFVDVLEDYLSAADVCLVPLLSGSGTRLKILEALANGLTVISTSIGAEGIEDLYSSKKLQIQDSIESFPEEILSVRNDNRKSPVKVTTHFSWKAIVRKIQLPQK